MRTLPALLLVVALGAAQENNPYLREIAAGIEKLRAEDTDQAMKHFAQAQRIAPQDWRGYAWQCIAHFVRADTEPDAKRRAAIAEEANAVAAEMTRRAGVRFTDPLYLYLRGVVLGLQEQIPQAYGRLKKAREASAHRFEPYAEFALRTKLENAFAQQALNLAGIDLRYRQHEAADKHLAEAEEGLSGTPVEVRYLRLRAVVCEHLQRAEEAIRHLRRVIALANDPRITSELTGNIAMIHFQGNRTKEGLEALAELDPNDEHPEVVAARCMHRYKQALDAPDSEKMKEALDYYRSMLAKERPTVSFRLAEQFSEMVLEKVGPQDAAREKPLLEEAVRIAQKEQARRPECPSLYYLLSRLHRLLGDAKLELHYQRLHELKKKEFDSHPPYDENGRPRCG